ncbi:MAG: hypothetical protein LBV32_07810 [Tannerellaceae bacterium]|jgi:hypothetical protein|nr:hypothetical protein [Tannerellaceae bacterium]
MLPDFYKQSMDQMQNLPTSVAPVRYFDLPGTMHRVNMKTMIIPDFEATTFDRVLTTGSTAAFNWLKSLSSENSSDWEKADAVLVLCRTHLITVYKDQHIQKLGADSYTHVFANQIKILISMNLADLPTSLGQYGASVLNIIKESSKMAYPTLANGDMYVAAQFDGYWQGMRIKKRQSEVISAMALQ